MHAASTASTPKVPHCITTALRLVRSAFSSASSAHAPASRIPNVKPPCRLAHSVISGRSHHDGARRASSARTSPTAQSRVTGRARMWGRVSDMRRCQHDGGEHQNQRGDGIELFQQHPREQPEGRGGRGSRERGDGGPAPEVLSARQDQLREPLLGDPGRPREGRRKRIDVRKCPLLGDPRADPDMPIRIRVRQHPVGEQQQQQVEPGRDEPWHRGTPRKGVCGNGGWGSLVGHAGTLLGQR